MNLDDEPSINTSSTTRLRGLHECATDPPTPIAPTAPPSGVIEVEEVRVEKVARMGKRALWGD
eukprot:4183279-Alexandrium_andersonii.AAC.1